MLEKYRDSHHIFIKYPKELLCEMEDEKGR